MFKSEPIAEIACVIATLVEIACLIYIYSTWR